MRISSIFIFAVFFLCDIGLSQNLDESIVENKEKIESIDKAYSAKIEIIIKEYVRICHIELKRIRSTGDLDLFMYVENEIKRAEKEKTLPDNIPNKLKELKIDVNELSSIFNKERTNYENLKSKQKNKYIEDLHRLERIALRNSKIDEAKKIREIINFESKLVYVLKGDNNWENSGIKILSGDVITIIPSESWGANKNTSVNRINTNSGALIAKIGEQLFSVDKKTDITSKESGDLLFRNNFAVSKNGNYSIVIIIGRLKK